MNLNIKKIITILLLLCSTFCTITNAQITEAVITTTTSPTVRKQANKNIPIIYVYVYPVGTAITLNLRNFYHSFWGLGGFVKISSTITLNYIDAISGKEISLHATGIVGGNEAFPMNFDTEYYQWDFHGDALAITVRFPPLPPGIRTISLRENVSGGWYWEDVQINPLEIGEVPRLANTKEEIMQLLSLSNSSYAGIYEEVGTNGHHLAFIQKDNTNYLLFVEQKDNPIWNIGEVKAVLRQTAAEGLFKCDWYMMDKTKNTNCIIAFEPGLMKVKIDDDETIYIKMALNEDDIISSNSNDTSTKWSGTGFALNNRYVVTNYHVAENAKKIEIYGVKNDFTKSYEAEVIGVDKVNDIALLRIKDDTFSGFGVLPYSAKLSMAEVGEDIFVLGYPLIASMGEEIKLTNGIISSRSGFDGDVALYQISAPVQPGNSGGPLFDKQGNLIGIVCAKHAGAENASYAIKMSYLRNLIESISDLKIIPTKNSISNLELKEQVKQITPFVFMIKCSN